MQRKVIISCEVTGSADTPGRNPAVPVTPEQIVRSSIDAAKAGAAIVHIHVRDPKTTKIGYVLATQVSAPASDKPEDVEAARAAIFAGGYRGEWNNSWWMRSNIVDCMLYLCYPILECSSKCILHYLFDWKTSELFCCPLPQYT